MSGRGLTITRAALREAASRRLLLVTLLASGAFLALFAVGFDAIFSDMGDVEADEAAFAATLLTVMGLYVVQFLAVFIAMLLAVGGVSTEIDNATAHATLARPVSRRRWLVERWLAFAIMVAGYTVLMTAAVLVVARVVAGYGALSPLAAIALLALETLVILTIGFAVSTRASTVVSGVVVVTLFGFAWLAGIIEIIGVEIGNRPMELVGIVVSLLVPSDELWRGASYFLQSPVVAAATAIGAGFGDNPLAGTAPPARAFLAWSLAHVALLFGLAVRTFRRRDL